jgi:class 3 adenylate cyclase/tetratricopeptide (TPR) repeat protein
MTFDEVLDQVRALLQQRGRVTYRALQRRFALDEEYLADLKGELIKAEGMAADEDGEVLVWVGQARGKDAEKGSVGEAEPEQRAAFDASRQPLDPRRDAAERRQLTVMFCDLVGSTTLSTQLDPEELREVVRAYQQACVAVIARYEGHIAQYLGDGLLVYFGYPAAHEDDAARAVRAGLGILATLHTSPVLAAQCPLQVRLGVHTGLVVVGEMGAGRKREQLALGDTPNIAARLQGLAEPDTVVMSEATHKLVQGLFEYQDWGPQTLKGVSTPVSVYRVLGESETQSRFEVAVRTGLTPLVGRDEELGVLRGCWEQAKAGTGQVVLLSGEPGIGKSRLVQTLKDQALAEGATRIEVRCSPYHQNSAFSPLIAHLQRFLQFAPQDPPQTKLAQLQHSLAPYRFPEAETLPLLAALLSLPPPEDAPPLTLSPQKQKQKTQEALVAWLVEEAENAVVYCVWEDLHWIDPSSLEVLTLLLDQVPTTRLLALLAFRPDFTPPWRPHASITQLTLNRLGRSEVEAMVEKVTGNKALPPEVLQQIVHKTDGVPLFVEELTKMVLESGLVRAVNGHYELSGPLPPLAIPSTLQDSLMARLDRLATVREVVQLGATLGREFSYELLHAVSAVDEGILQQGLRQLTEAELLYQRGLPPQATYLFKHALVQDAAYQSLLKSTRQQYHTKIAQVLEGRFPETKETQPELLAQHYTAAGLITEAIPYWQQAGQRAIQRSAHAEAVSHFTRGIELLRTIPETPERLRHELTLQTALSSALVVTKGLGAHEVRKAYDEALELCQRMGEAPQLGPVLCGLSAYYIQQEEMQVASDLAEQCLTLAERQQDSSLIVAACRFLVNASYWSGNPRLAHEYCERGMARYDPLQHRSLSLGYGFDQGVFCLGVGAWALWYLGYPDQALQRSQAMLALAYEGNYPYTLAYALDVASWTRFYRREEQVACTLADEAIALSTTHEFPHWLAMGRWMRGQALIELGRWEEGTAQLQQGLEAYRATGALIGVRGCGRTELARGYGYQGRIEEGLHVISEALAGVNQVRHYEAEMYRLKGMLTLQSKTSREQVSDKSQASQNKSEDPNTQHPTPSTHAEAEAEACFLKASEIARRQQAKSLELRAVMSLSRLWQQQGKKAEAQQMLAEIYGWFTEGFDTKDLQEAKVLLKELT